MSDDWNLPAVISFTYASVSKTSIHLQSFDNSGRHGSDRDDNRESCARIYVTKDTNGEDTVVKLHGTQNALKKAKDLIKYLKTDTIQLIEAKDIPKNISTEPPNHEIIDWQTFLKECDEAEKAEWAKYPPIIKKFYVEHEQISMMSERIVDEFRMENNDIIVERRFKTKSSLPIPKPCPSFHHAFHNHPEILREIKKAGFSKPSPIQAQAFPVLLSGEDLIGIAQSGTGKTLAFLLPALIHIDGQSGRREDRGGPAVLIMAPTREFALQIDNEIKKYKYRNVRSVCVYGGVNGREQVEVLKEADIVIATPRRLNELVAAEHISVKTVTYVVLDEADRMVDMGFEPQIRKILYAIRPTRQTVITISATWPLGVGRLAQSYMNDPIQVFVSNFDLAALRTVAQVIQLITYHDAKLEMFMKFAHNLWPHQKVIVFCRMKAQADHLSSELALSGIRCECIHDDRELIDREQALADIRDGTIQLLIATDVVSRGLDITHITHVVNYDFPKDIDEYVHRLSRTSRASKRGTFISYFSERDSVQAKVLISILEETEQYVPAELYEIAKWYRASKEKRGSRRGGRGRGGEGKFDDTPW